MKRLLFESDVIKSIEKGCLEEWLNCDPVWHTSDVISAIKDTPSAQPEQPSEIQDILNYLDTVLHPIISPEHWNIYSELHDMISMLPSAQPNVPDTNVGDTIYRQAAIDTINELHDKPNAWLDLAIDALENLPSAQTDRKKGRWIPMSNGTYYKCSECGYARMKGDDNFCKECGTDMRKRSEGGKTD